MLILINLLELLKQVILKNQGINPLILNPNNIPIPYKPQIGNPKNKKNEIMEQQKNENDIKEEDEEDI